MSGGELRTVIISSAFEATPEGLYWMDRLREEQMRQAREMGDLINPDIVTALGVAETLAFVNGRQK